MINIGDYVTYEGPPPLNWRAPVLYLWDIVFPYLCDMCTEVDRVCCGREAEHPPTLYGTKDYLLSKLSAMEYWMRKFDVQANIWCE